VLAISIIMSVFWLVALTAWTYTGLVTGRPLWTCGAALAYVCIMLAYWPVPPSTRNSEVVVVIVVFVCVGIASIDAVRLHRELRTLLRDAARRQDEYYKRRVEAYGRHAEDSTEAL